jgi:hypothetical protein
MNTSGAGWWLPPAWVMVIIKRHADRLGHVLASRLSTMPSAGSSTACCGRSRSVSAAAGVPEGPAGDTLSECAHGRLR